MERKLTETEYEIARAAALKLEQARRPGAVISVYIDGVRQDDGSVAYQAVIRATGRLPAKEGS